ncbi:MAG TPA: helix-turn-helix domain-containing protein [Clostridia bacterium]|nr:helix-turn-helix domain-containing protein [Clostridia bacterium]
MYKVLLVDDEPSAIERLSMLDWGRFGFTVCGTAQNGEDALEIIKLCDPDLVVTDLKMPVIDGLKLIGICSEILNSTAKFVILSGYGEFAYAQEAMKYNAAGYILKPFVDTELEETISKMAQLIRNDRMSREYTEHRLAFVARQTLRRITEGEVKAQLLERAAMFLGIVSDDPIKCLLINAGTHKTDVSIADDRAMLSNRSQVRKIIESSVGEFRYNLFEDSDGRFGLILCEKMPFYNAAGSFSMELAGQLKGLTDGPVLLSLSAPAAGVAMLPEIYRQSRRAQDFAWFFGEGCLVRYEAIQDKNMDDLPCMESPRELIEVVSREAADRIELTVRHLFGRFMEGMKAPGSVRAFVKNFEFEAVNLIDGLNGSPDDLARISADFDKVVESLTMKKLQDSFLELCLQLALKLNSLKQSSNRDIISELKNYIRNNFNKDITLKELASVFFMNPIYLGQLFRKSTGKQFNEYLHEVRIEEAKKLLKRTGMKISEIALAVGYNDPKYFLSKFRSIAKQAPSEYKLNNT